MLKRLFVQILIFIGLRWLTILVLFLAGYGAGNHSDHLNMNLIYVVLFCIQIIGLFLYMLKTHFNFQFISISGFILLTLHIASRYFNMSPIIPY